MFKKVFFTPCALFLYSLLLLILSSYSLCVTEEESLISSYTLYSLIFLFSLFLISCSLYIIYFPSFSEVENSFYQMPERWLEATGECFVLCIGVSWLVTAMFNPGTAHSLQHGALDVS